MVKSVSVPVRTKLLTLFFSAALSIGISVSALFASTRPFVLIASYDGSIGPASCEWLVSAIRNAEQEGANALIFQIDTPGGLLESTRLLVKEMLSSPCPIVVYVSPAGSRAASAGTFITLAAHVAAMAPGTRIGAAHPVELGKASEGDLRLKLENDTVAFIKSIAEIRKRNSSWAEDSVRKSSSSTEGEALALGAIDCVAKDLDDLFKKIDGKAVATAGGEKVLRTQDSERRYFPMSLRVKFFKTLTDPNIAYILLIVGMYGLLYEIISPGAIFPGVAGSICLLVGLYAMQTLPVNYAGVGLLILAVLLFVIESQVVSGLIGLGGLIALALGSLLLVPQEFPGFKIETSLVLSVSVLTGLFLFFAVAALLKVRQRKPVSGAEGIVGETAVAKTDLTPRGQVLYGGEIWNAQSEENVLQGEEVE
ncbi:MAG: nodulation protein NfeD, partial [Elusimicrobia bacterium]|nr:nodulation protein NfeD [Elusimicrobiota bacterium]